VITYFIAKGSSRKLVNVQIVGATYFRLDTLRERMFLQPASFQLRHGRYSEAFRKNDEEALENLYRANGFRDVSVTSKVETDYKGKSNSLAATFTIKEGTQWRIAKLKTEGAAQLDISEVVSELSSADGQPYSDVSIASDRNRVLEYYYAHGFPNATFTATIQPAEEPYAVNLTYQLTEGRREFVRRVILSGLRRTRPSLVQRRIKIADGEPIDQTKIGETARSLTDLGIFAKVNTAVQNSDGTNQYKYLLYDFDEAARYTFDFGFGAEIAQFGGTTSNLNRAGGQTGFSPRFALNVNRLNFLGIGQTLSLQTRYSTLQQRASLNYIVPHLFGSTRRTVTFSALYDMTQDVTTFSSKREEASVQTSERLSKASTLLVRFSYRRVTTSDVVIPSLLIPQLLQPVRIGILSVSYIQDRRDSPTDAHRGSWNTLDVGLAGKFFGSERNFVRVLGRNATYTPIGRNLVFARQTQLGEIKSFNLEAGLSSADAIPLPERFFGGGASSMRGFGYNQAGPRDIGTPTAPATGYPLGGNALFFNTFELRFPLTGPNLSGVLFHDMGNVFSSFNNISFNFHQKNNTDFDYSVQAVGFGIRYKTPLGPVRLDLAYALNPPRYMGYSGTTQQLTDCSNNGQIGLTPACTSSPQQLSHFQFFFSIGQAF
jgi:outer membrane protein assembly complex protein YaeT